MTTTAEIAETDATESSSVGGRPRNPWIATALAIFFSSTGLVYCGRLRRAVLWEIGVFFVLIATGCLFLYLPNGRVAWIGIVFLLVGYKLGLIVDTARIALRRDRATQWYQSWWFYLGYPIATGLVTLGVVQLSRTYWEEAFYIPTGSMSPTVLKGDRILVDKWRYRSTPIQHSDVIVHWLDSRQAYSDADMAPPGRQCYVKRVVGLPGDVVEFRDEKLIRNGASVDEPYAAFVPASGRVDPRLTDMAPVTVGKNELFVVGDNRRESLDSRFFGCVPREDVVGRVAIIYWSREAPPEAHVPFSPPDQQRPATEPSRRIRWERFGLRVE